MEQQSTRRNDIIVIMPPPETSFPSLKNENVYVNGKNRKRRHPGYHHHSKIIAPLAFLAGVSTVVFQREFISLHSVLRYYQYDDGDKTNNNANDVSGYEFQSFQTRRMQADYENLVDANNQLVNDETTLGRFRNNNTSNNIKDYNSHNQYNSEKKIAWLLSFPNSGTSYTTKLVKRVTRTSTATNYGEESDFLDPVTGGNVPVVEWSSGGPFWSSSSSSSSRIIHDDVGHSRGLSSPLVLTKTHCTGRCVSCTAKEYLTNLTEFYNGCQTGKRYHVVGGNYANDPEISSNFTTAAIIDDKNPATSHSIVKKYEKTLEVTHYDAASLVTKAIHLLRNPLDNIVARFHLARKRSRKKGESDFEEFTSKYSNDREGFREWCRHLDEKEEYLKVERELFSREDFSDYYGFDVNEVSKSKINNGTNNGNNYIGKTILRAMEGIPCHADFFRYAQWHNLAFRMISEMNIPELVLRYENYESNFDFTLYSILQFLGFNLNDHGDRDDGDGDGSSNNDARIMRGKPKEFVGGKSYVNYFTVDEIGKVKELMRLVGSEVTWDHVRHYF